MYTAGIVKEVFLRSSFTHFWYTVHLDGLEKTADVGNKEKGSRSVNGDIRWLVSLSETMVDDW